MYNLIDKNINPERIQKMNITPNTPKNMYNQYYKSISIKKCINI